MSKNSGLVPNDDGTYTVELSSLGRADVNGVRKTPLTEDAFKRLRKRALMTWLPGEIGHPLRHSGESQLQFNERLGSISAKRVGFAIVDLKETREGDVQHITGRILPVGPLKEVIPVKIARHEPLYFGMRAFTMSPQADGICDIVSVICWDLINNDPYP